MIRAARRDEVHRRTGDWCVVDLGFSGAKRSCGVLIGENPAAEVTFSKLVSEVTAISVAENERPMCLRIEAPLSVAFEISGNLTGRSHERRGSQTRYWYAGLGTSVLTAATYLLRALVNRGPTGEVLLVEGFASFKSSERTSHAQDVLGLREAVWSELPEGILAADALAMHRTDRIVSAFAVAQMDFGVPPVVVIDG